MPPDDKGNIWCKFCHRMRSNCDASDKTCQRVAEWRKRQEFDPSDVLRDLAANQEPLGAEFEKLLNENLKQLYEE